VRLKASSAPTAPFPIVTGKSEKVMRVNRRRTEVCRDKALC
jgi:hypothetical protein